MADDNVTAKDVRELLEHVIEEKEALIEKSPAWAKWVIGALLVSVTAAAVVACAVGAVGTGPGAPVASLACIGLVIALMAAVSDIFLGYLEEDRELDEIRAKERRLKRLQAALSSQDGGG